MVLDVTTDETRLDASRTRLTDHCGDDCSLPEPKSKRDHHVYAIARSEGTVIDLMKCFSCGAVVPDTNGPTHPYMESSPGCWQVYGEILARQFTDPALRDVQRWTADSYAVQHPGRPSPVAIQSVCGHLMSLCVVVERHAPYSYADRILNAAVEGRIPFWWLTPPRSLGELTVVDVHAATSADDHREKAHAWAHSAWSAWVEHHETIRTWIASGF